MDSVSCGVCPAENGRHSEFRVIPGLHICHFTHFLFTSGDVEHPLRGRIHYQVRGPLPGERGRILRSYTKGLCLCSVLHVTLCLSSSPLHALRSCLADVHGYTAGMSSGRVTAISTSRTSTIICPFSLAPLFLLVRKLFAPSPPDGYKRLPWIRRILLFVKCIKDGCE